MSDEWIILGHHRFKLDAIIHFSLSKNKKQLRIDLLNNDFVLVTEKPVQAFEFLNKKLELK